MFNFSKVIILFEKIFLEINFQQKVLKKNEKITKDNINSLRPKIGICASQYFNILGKKVKNSKANEQFKKSFIIIFK